MISSDIGRSLVGAHRTPEARDNADRPREQRRRERDVEDDDSPRHGSVRAVLQLADRHLREEKGEDAGAAAHEPREPLALLPGPHYERDEDDAEDGDRANVPVDG